MLVSTRRDEGTVRQSPHCWDGGVGLHQPQEVGGHP